MDQGVSGPSGHRGHQVHWKRLYSTGCHVSPITVLHLQFCSLHWIVPPLDDQEPARVVDAMGIQDIIAFDTVGETFRWMRRPAQPGPWPLLFRGQRHDGLVLCGTGDGTSHTDIHVLVMQDYEAGVWALIHQISISPSRSLLADSIERQPLCLSDGCTR